MTTVQTVRKLRIRFFNLTVLGLVLSINVFFRLAFAEDVQYDSSLNRDPMVPVVQPSTFPSPNAPQEAPRARLEIQGIVVDPRHGAIALIDGEMKKVGDSVGDAVIVQILKDRILLTQNDEQRVVWLREEVVANSSGNS